MFGEEDVINERAYTTSVKCITATGSVYCIKSEEFFQRLGRDEKTWRKIVERIRQKDIETKRKVKKLTVYNHKSLMDSLNKMYK